MNQRIRWEGKRWIDVLGLVKQRADRMAEPLFIGEFCEMRTLAEAPSSPFPVRLMAKMLEWDIPLAAIWVWYRSSDKCNIAEGIAESLIEKIRQGYQALAR